MGVLPVAFDSGNTLFCLGKYVCRNMSGSSFLVWCVTGDEHGFEREVTTMLPTDPLYKVL